MSLVDSRGRLFGAMNLVDAAIVAFVIVLIPLAYGTYLLFRPAKPHIDSVEVTGISKEEIRIAGGAGLTAKLKVKGSGFNPLLRAQIGDSHALGFVFENPNSADVLVGQVGANDHDLILFDGVQEVARAVNAFRLPAAQPGVSTFIRGVGRFMALDPPAAETLKPGFKFPEAVPDFEVIAVGPPALARSSVRFGSSQFDTPMHGLVEREAVLKIRCDSALADSPCAIGSRMASQPAAPVVLTFSSSSPGSKATYRFMVTEVLPDVAAQRAKLQVRLAGGPHLASLRVGDRDAFLDERAAVITAIGSRTGDAVSVTLDLGLDDSREGWRYRDQRVKPGATFAFATDRYEAVGTIDSVTLVTAERGGGL